MFPWILGLIIVILGIFLLVSYFWVFRHTKGYVTNKLWLGLPVNLVRGLVVLQIFSVLGFFAAYGTWLVKGPPKTGFLAKPLVLEILTFLFLSSALLWPWAVQWKNKALQVSSLSITALVCLLLLGGSVTEESPSWWVVLGLLFLCHTTVLSDGVVWSAKRMKVSF